MTQEEVDFKAVCFADNVDIGWGTDQNSNQEIFKQYERLKRKIRSQTKCRQNGDYRTTYGQNFQLWKQYNGQTVQISTLKDIKNLRHLVL